MDESFAARYYSTEEVHWWCVGRRDMVLRLLKDTPKDSAILDIGCSGGALLKSMKESGFSAVVGVDIDEKAIAACRQAGFSDVYAGCATELGFPDGRFKVVVASDVLEHIDDEDAALSEWRRVLAPGGRLIVFVPAFEFLWSSHDEINHHFRRYSRSRLVAAIRRNGFAVEHLSFWNLAFFLPAAAARLAQKALRLEPKARARYQLVSSSETANRLLACFLRIENGLLAALGDFPFGISLFVVAKKP